MADASDQPGFAARDLSGLELAERIEADARERLDAAQDVDLERYIAAVPDLTAEPTALDAAIDMTIRSMVSRGIEREQAAAMLAEKYPHFREAIEVAVELDHALWSTHSVSRYFDHTQPQRDLPAQFGPPLEDGASRYELLQLLGAGSFGQVYLARDRQLSDSGHDAMVSVKILPSGLRTGHWSPWLSDEATKARRVRHPNVVSVLDRGTAPDGDVFIVYEFVDGGDLREYIESRGEPLSQKEAARIIAAIAEGVHAAHMAGLVHCDLKPSNIVLTAGGEPKIADFGVARRFRDTEDGDAPTEDRIGNPAFMSPEQYRMERGSLTIPTDIYALGGMLYWLVTGHYPNGSTPTQIARRHVDSEHAVTSPSMRHAIPAIDKDLDRICQRALAVQPDERHDSARALATDLRRWLSHEPIEWMHITPWKRASLWVRRRPGTAITVLAASVLMVVSLLVAAAFAQDAAIKQAKIDIDAELREDFFGLIAMFEESATELQESGLYDRLFRDIWFGRWLYEPRAWFDPGDLAHEIDRTLVETVRAQVEHLRATSDSSSIRVLMWEGCLAFLCVQEQRWAEAIEIIDITAPKARATLSMNDPWHLHLRGLRTIADVHLNPTTDAAALREHEATLLETEADLAVNAKWSPMHRLVIGALEYLYQPEQLDEPQRAAQMRALLDEVAQTDSFTE